VVTGDQFCARVIDDAFHAVPTDPEGWWLSIILPLVVVPEDRLWVVDYSDDATWSRHRGG